MTSDIVIAHGDTILIMLSNTSLHKEDTNEVLYLDINSVFGIMESDQRIELENDLFSNTKSSSFGCCDELISNSGSLKGSKESLKHNKQLFIITGVTLAFVLIAILKTITHTE